MYHLRFFCLCGWSCVPFDGTLFVVPDTCPKCGRSKYSGDITAGRWEWTPTGGRHWYGTRKGIWTWVTPTKGELPLSVYLVKSSVLGRTFFCTVCAYTYTCLFGYKPCPKCKEKP